MLFDAPTACGFIAGLLYAATATLFVISVVCGARSRS